MRKYLVAMSVSTLVALLLVSAPISIGKGQAGSNGSKPGLDDLSFISGLWETEWGGGLGEEHWSARSGDSMVGTFRFIKEGKARFYELMLIEQTATGLVLRLKHFNPGLVGWEEKAQVYSYSLIEYQKDKAVFEVEDKTSRLTFQRTSKEALSVQLDQSRNGKQSAQEFKFKLVK